MRKAPQQNLLVRLPPGREVDQSLSGENGGTDPGTTGTGKYFHYWTKATATTGRSTCRDREFHSRIAHRYILTAADQSECSRFTASASPASPPDAPDQHPPDPDLCPQRFWQKHPAQ